MYNIKDGNALIPGKEMNRMGTETGFGVDGAKDAFHHKEYQHIQWIYCSEEYDEAHDVDTHAPVFFLFSWHRTEWKKTVSKLKCPVHPCKISIFCVYQADLGLFIQPSKESSFPSGRHPEDIHGWGLIACTGGRLLNLAWLLKLRGIWFLWQYWEKKEKCGWMFAKVNFLTVWNMN